MFLLHELPFDLSNEIVSNWLKVDDLTKVDCALPNSELNKSYRDTFLRLMSSRHSYSDDSLVVKSIFNTSFLRWVSLRGLKLESLYLTGDEWASSHILNSLDFSKVGKIKVNDSDASSVNKLADVINKCPCLRVLGLNGLKHLTDWHLEAVHSKVLQQLVRLEITDCPVLSVGSLYVLALRCESLLSCTVKYNDHMLTCKQDDFVLTLLCKHNLHLETLKCDVPLTSGNSLLSHLLVNDCCVSCLSVTVAQYDISLVTKLIQKSNRGAAGEGKCGGGLHSVKLKCVSDGFPTLFYHSSGSGDRPNEVLLRGWDCTPEVEAFLLCATAAPPAPARGVEKLDLAEIRDLSDFTLLSVVNKCKATLHSLSLSECESVTVTALLEVFRECKLLNAVSLSAMNQLSNEDILTLFPATSDVIHLVIRDHDTLTYHTVTRIIENCQHLTSLTIYNCERADTDQVHQFLVEQEIDFRQHILNE